MVDDSHHSGLNFDGWIHHFLGFVTDSPIHLHCDLEGSTMLSLMTLLACNGDKSEPVVPTLQPGAPQAGVAEGKIDIPVGTPMGWYSNRCFFLGGAGTVDERESQYSMAFSTTAGVQTSIMAEVLWLDNGDQEWILITIDSIYSNDELVREVERQIESSVGIDVEGKVIISASHTHHAPANYSDQVPFYLGGDRYNEEVFQRYSTSLADLAIQAFQTKVPAKIGFGMLLDWDPENLVYSDRRSENNDLGFWEDIDGDYKNPELWMLRVDDTNDNPLGIFFNFGIHGTSLGADNPLFSVDAPGHLEFAFQERFDHPIVVGHFQGGGGDVTPTGTSAHGHPYARMEGISEFAVDTFYDLWASIPTSDRTFTLETITRSITQGQEDIHVTRNGSVDWYYPAYEEDYEPDLQIYDSNGSLRSPFDEWNTEYGAVFCGYDEPFLSTGTIGADVYPYNGCVQVEPMMGLLGGVFQLTEYFPNGIPLPLPSSTKAQTSALKMGPVSILKPDGSVAEEDIFMGFFPGEATSYYVRHYRDRVGTELGYDNVILGDYAQDHEGYLLIPEDWLLGGYETNINLWGPLQAEYLMEQNLKMSTLLQTNLLEDPNPNGEYDSTSYADRPLPTLTPDRTSLAGTVAEVLSEDLYIPLSTEPKSQPDPVLPRVQGLAQFTWEGGDPAVDNPHIVVETKNARGYWVELETNSGRSVDETLPDVLLTHTPTPLEPFEAVQDHQWWAGWQTVSSSGDRMGLPTGEYRLHVYGHHYIGTEETYPWSVEVYDITSAPFIVEPAELSISVNETSNGLLFSLTGPDWGYRLIDIEGSSTGNNPPMGLEVTLNFVDGTTETRTDTTLFDQQLLLEDIDTADLTEVIAIDMFGNQGEWTP